MKFRGFILVLGFSAICRPEGARAEFTRCEKLLAEAAELRKASPAACEESKDTHARYLQAFAEIHETCRSLETEANSPAPLRATTENEARNEAMERKQRHLAERMRLADRFSKELLRTPLDNDDPARIPPQVSSECGTEVESYARFRKNALRGLGEFFHKIDEADDALFQQANALAEPKLQKP